MYDIIKTLTDYRRVNMIKKLLSMMNTRKLLKWFFKILPCAIYAKALKKLPIDNKKILLEAQHGGEISGNIFYILKELSTSEEYKSFDLYLSCKTDSKRKIKNILDSYGIENVRLVTMFSPKYMKTAASAKYLFNDNTFLPFFTKKEGQVYLNTWHGTPLKTLGKGIKNSMHNIGNTQKNFVCADYLLYPNEYTMEHMVKDYMLENLAKGKCLLGGYPRNTVFFDTERRSLLREKFGGENTRIYAYMPTWRGTVSNINESANNELRNYFDELDGKLQENEILYVNLHPIANKDLDFSRYSKIKKFPENLETYDFLNCTDCLITDYSSVFFDYAVTGNKCILFAYDEEEYFAERGVYKPLTNFLSQKLKPWRNSFLKCVRQNSMTTGNS